MCQEHTWTAQAACLTLETRRRGCSEWHLSLSANLKFLQLKPQAAGLVPAASPLLLLSEIRAEASVRCMICSTFSSRGASQNFSVHKGSTRSKMSFMSGSILSVSVAALKGLRTQSPRQPHDHQTVPFECLYCNILGIFEFIHGQQNHFK